MTPPDSTQGSQATYNFWLGLIPQFLGQFGAAPGAAATAEPKTGSANNLMFPADQVAKAAAMTQQSLQALAQSFAAMLQAGGVPNLLSQWATVAPAFASAKPADATAAAAAATQAMFGPWAALMANAAGATAQGTRPPAYGGAEAPAFSLQALSQAWADMGKQLTGATPEQLDAAFDRAFGALSDAFGLSPARKLQAAWRETVAASLAHQDAQAKYAVLVQNAFAQGFQRLLAALAEKANAGERIDSVLALLRLWAGKTEEAVHEILQSESGLAATAALLRSGLAYRKKMQQVAAIYAGVLDMATRHEVDEAYREIQALKRELRARGPAGAVDAGAAKRAASSKAAPAKSKKSKAGGASA